MLIIKKAKACSLRVCIECVQLNLDMSIERDILHVSDVSVHLTSLYEDLSNISLLLEKGVIHK